MRNLNVHKGILLLILVLFAGVAQGQKKYKVSPNQMTGQKIYSLYGPVKKVTYTNGDFIEVDKYGNVTKIKLGHDKGEYTYESDIRYKYYGEFYNILFTDNMRIEKWDNQHEDLSTDYTFDANGRIIGKFRAGYGDSTSSEYEYEGKNLLPSKSVESNGWESGSATTTTLYTYTDTDSQGNWTSCKTEITSVLSEEDRDPVTTKETQTYKREITYYTADELAQGESYPQIGSTSTGSGSGSGKSWSGDDVKEVLIQILVALLLFAAIGHMVYINFIRGKRFQVIYSPEYFKEKRRENNQNEVSSTEENEQAYALLNEAFCKWPLVKSSNDDEEYRKPRRMKQINAAAALIDQAIALAPTDADTVDRINELTDVVNSNEERYFTGSKLLIGVAIGVTILIGYTSGGSFLDAWPFAVSIALYILASRTPAFLVDKRAESRMGSVSSGIFAGVFALIASAPTVRTTTKWSDGSKTVEDDDTLHWLSWIVGLAIIFLLGAFIILWALFNYLRNYILYI